MISMRMISPAAWLRAPLQVRQLPPLLAKRTDRILERLVVTMRNDLQAAILGDESALNLRLRKLNDAYIARKGHDRALVDTASYVGAVQVLDVAGVKGVGLPSANYPGTTLSYRTLARFFEYGTATMRPLPHWRRLAEHGKKLLRAQVKEMLADAVRIT